MIRRGNICEDPGKWRSYSICIQLSLSEISSESAVPATRGYRCESDCFKGAMVHRGTNSLRLIGEAGTPCLRRDMMSVHFKKAAILCYVKTRMWA